MGSAAPFASGNPRIRAAETGDAGDVARLLDLLGYPCDPDEAAERISVIAHDQRQQLLLAEVDGHACALISLHSLYSVAHGNELARITALVVDPAFCRRGIGRLLLREVELLSRRHGIHRIEVTSNARREAAHAFYRDCGYDDGSLRFIKMLGD